MAATTSLLGSGDVVGGFRVEDLIGVGGMATVYRAEQISLGRRVALKVLLPQFTGDGVFRERFRREGMHAASLEHPNIVPVYDSGEQSGLLYLAMRLVEGSSLAERLSSKGVTADEAIEILGPIASALDCAHAAGLIHRDVKPQNILITGQGHPYLADFGVAKAPNAPGLTATGGFVGSVNYASPEQIKSLPLTAASDVYSLAAVLYHCLSGDVPYPGESEAGVMHAHLHEPPPTLPDLEGADGEFRAVFARGMAKDPGARYGRAGELLSAAAGCVSRMPSAGRAAIPAFPRGEPGPGRGSVERAPAAAGIAAAPVEPAAPGSLTAVDPRREPAVAEEPAEPSRARRPRLPQRPALPRPPSPVGPLRRARERGLPSMPRVGRGPLIAAAALAVFVAAVLALVAHGSGGNGASAGSIRKGPVGLSYGAPWRGVAADRVASTYGLRFEAPVALARPGATLVAGMLADGAPVPGGVPPELAARLDRGASRSATRLGGAAAIRYAATARRGATAVTLFVVPTGVGDIGLLCAAAPGAGGSCAQTAGTLRLFGVKPVAAGADPTLAGGLRSALRPLDAIHGHDSDLATSAAASRAKAARQAAALDLRAAKRLAALPAQPRDRAAVAGLGGALRREGKALKATATAAAGRRYAAYAHAEESIRPAGLAVARAVAALRRIGFAALPALGPLDVPPLRRPRPPVESTSPAPETSTTPSAPVAPAPEPEPEPAPEPSSPSPPAEHPTVPAQPLG